MKRRYIHAGAIVAAVAFSDAPASAQQRPAPRPNNLFTVSGFDVRIANTPERLKELRKLPPNKLVTRERDGKTYYVYADPAGCNCAYVGTPEAYRTYQNGGPSNSAGGSGGTRGAVPRFDTNQIVEEMARDRYGNDPGAANRFLFGR